MRTQVVVWTALPNGIATTAGSVNLSVFINPQLITNEGGSNPTLELFPDWWDWPQVMQQSPLSFEVIFQGYPAVTVTPNLTGLAPTDWTAVFPNPNVVGVTPYKPESYAGVPMHSFDMNGVEQFVSNLYGSLGLNSPLAPPVLSTNQGRFEPPRTPRALANDLAQLFNLTACAAEGLGTPGTTVPPVLGGSTTISSFLDGFRCAVGANAIGQARAFHLRPAPPIPEGSSYPAPFEPAVTTLDFHQAVSALGSFPAVLRALGLVFDLVVPLPAGITSGTHNVNVVPSWFTRFDGEEGRRTINLTMQTNCELTTTEFQAVPVGPDYGNRMLDLADTSRFSVVDLDVDGASEQLYNLSLSLQNLSEWIEPEDLTGQTMAVTVPALRSTGPKIVWSGWGNSGGGLSNLMTRQGTIASDVQTWVNWQISPSGPEPGLPVLQAEDIIKGHRFDVLPLSDPTPQWLSLQQRIGSYVFGTPSATSTAVALPPANGNSGTPGLDEGVVTPSATSAADTAVTPPPPDLYVSESIVNWTGWSLAAPRYGQQIDPSDQLHDNRGNPAYTEPDPVTGNMNPQVSATFAVAPGTLPKLRFGNEYRYRARAVDLAGNSVPVTDLDATTATPPEQYHRYQPIVSPAMAQIQPLGPGEATLLVAIVNYQSPPMPVAENGRWLFPPKATEMLVETHGMLDGFNPGSAPDRADPPNPQSWALLAGTSSTPGLADAGLGNLGGVEFDTNNDSAPYFPVETSPAPVAPWLYDPLSRGVSILGYPGLFEPILHEWTGGPWPGADAQLLMVRAGAALGRHFTPGSASAPPTETITLPPVGVLNLGISSALTSPLTLGVWRWMESAATTEFQRLALYELALRGQLWMLTPYTAVRLVHAVRLPLVGPHMVHPIVTRTYGSVQASIVDTHFVLDAPSTAEIDAEAGWIDRIDDPSDATNNPAVPADSSAVSLAHAYKGHVPDPLPLNALDQPMQVFPPPTEFPILTDPGVIHNLGDTKHHTVAYQHTATSRFAEFFPDSGSITLTGTTPGVLGTLGVDPASLVLISGAVTLEQSTDAGATGDYVVLNPVAGEIALTSGTGQNYSGDVLDATWTLYDQTVGVAHTVQIPSSASPKSPQIVRVSPAWSFTYPAGSVEDSGGVLWARNGGYIRVYIDRPWWSSGNDEMLGVVGLPPALQDGNKLPATVSASHVSLMGLDPISVSSTRNTYPIAPDSFEATAAVPAAPYRPAYSSPPEIALLENPTGPKMQIWPYQVQYDPASQLWYADVQLTIGAGGDAPPPGYFVRLALVRFQPYSIVGAEISTVALCGFCQPVADRFVSIASNTSDKTNTSLFVTISGPGYHGWRPPQPYGAAEPQAYDRVQPDITNQYAPRVYELAPDNVNTPVTSTMVVEVQVQNTSTGLTGELSWTPAPGTEPVMLNQSISGSNEVVWEYLNVGGGKQAIKLPHPIDGATPMRLRISELDYYQTADGAPKSVGTSFRRPFVALIPIV